MKFTIINFDKDCTTPLAEEMLNLYAEYVEGGISSSGLEYNKKISQLSLKDIIYMIYRTPFSGHAVEMYNMLLTQLSDQAFPEEINAKIKIHKESIKNYKEGTVPY